jgi:hypothetical protein
MKKFKAILLATLLLTSVNAKAEDFYLGISFTSHHVIPFMKANISQSHPTSINRFKYNEVHHLYWGGMLAITGYLMHNKTLTYIGSTIAFDDLIQHTLRINTPFHMLNDQLGKSKLYRDFVGEFERR